MTEQELLDKITVLMAQRENFLIQANQTIGNFNGQISVYQKLLENTRKNAQEAQGSTESKSSNGLTLDEQNAILPPSDALKSVSENGDMHEYQLQDK